MRSHKNDKRRKTVNDRLAFMKHATYRLSKWQRKQIKLAFQSHANATLVRYKRKHGL